MGCSSSNSRNAANEKVIIEKIIKTEPELKAAFDNFTSDDIERIFILAKVRSYSPNEIICSKGKSNVYIFPEFHRADHLTNLDAII